MRIQAALLCGLISCLSISFLAHADESTDRHDAPAKAVKKTPPFPREGTDMETQMREQDEYIRWRYENTENVSTIIVKLKPEIDGMNEHPVVSAGAPDFLTREPLSMTSGSRRFLPTANKFTGLINTLTQRHRHRTVIAAHDVGVYFGGAYPGSEVRRHQEVVDSPTDIPGPSRRKI